MRHLILALAATFALPATAQERILSHCIALAQTAPGLEYLHRASFRDPVPDDQVRITYVDHAMFLIQTPNVAAMTDFTGYSGNVDFIPDVVTMNNAHSTHWTAAPDPAITHVLEGWARDGRAAYHELDLGEMLIRNVPTDIRSGGGVRQNGNSIFVFEAAGLCIAHLGHLHHEPDAFQYAALGRMDVVMAPVDGGMTLNQETMIAILERVRARIVIPMHWFGQANLDRFIAGMEGGFVIDRRDEQTLVLGLSDLPDRPTVVVLRPGFLTD
jgi:L-ascorbate metabolism protein UlaG (beta-lactamase superfamily)